MQYIIIGLVVGLTVNAIGAYFMRNAAILKGYGDNAHIGAICFWLGVLGYLYVIALPDKITQGQNQQIIDLLSKKGVNL